MFKFTLKMADVSAKTVMFAKLKSVVLFIKFTAIQNFYKISLLNVHIFTFKKPGHTFQTQNVRYV